MRQCWFLLIISLITPRAWPCRDIFTNPTADIDSIYVTDNLNPLSPTITDRTSLYDEGLAEKWSTLPPKFSRTTDGEEILVVGGLEVMREFERPYMVDIAETLSSAGGIVVNVGYGLGIIDYEVALRHSKYGIREHHIIELNHGIAERARMWRENSPHREKIFVHEGDWKTVLSTLSESGVIFDGIAYDAFPLEAKDLHRDFVPFLQYIMERKLVRERSGLVTFYMDSTDGFGTKFKSFASALGVGSFETNRISVILPPNQYWRVPFFLTPKLGSIRYPLK